jgi:hypothetical protein
MNRLSKSIGGLLFGAVLLFSAVAGVTTVHATDFGLENIAAPGVTGGVGNTIDPCLNNGGAFGFVFCPAVETFAGVIDYFLDTMKEGFNWVYIADSDSGLNVLGVWSNLLPIANILFALVFIFVIYSVATGSGFSNYNIKKIVPRLVLVAIAVNVSYYICAAMIDISNIIGAGIYDIVSGVLYSGDPGITFTNLANSVFSNSSSGANLVGTSGSIGALLILLINYGVVLLSIGAVFVGVAARNVVMMMLLLASPLAFSMALLPSTESIFKKWGNNFLRLLVIYPAFMFVWAICRSLQAAFINADANVLELILAMLLSVAPALVIIPLFKGTSGLTGKVAGVIQRGSAGLSPANITNNQTNNKKVNSQTMDQINQKKFTTDKSITTNAKSSNNGGVQNTFSDESNSALSNRTTLTANDINAVSNVKTTNNKSKRQRTLSASLKSKQDISNVQKESSLSQNSISNSSSATTISSSNSASRQTNSAINANRGDINQNSNSATNSSIINNNTAAAPKLDLNGQFDKLSDVVKAKTQGQQLTRERAMPAAKAPTQSRQLFTESSSGDKKAERAFDVSTKSPTTNIFSGDGQQVSIKNDGETSQLIEQKVLNGSALTGDAPSIVSADSAEQAVDELGAVDDANAGTEINPLTEAVRNNNEADIDEAAASAPSIVQDVISDKQRSDRFVGQAGQKELAKLLTIANIKQFLPSDIDYILGIGPLLDTDGQQLAPIGDISKEPEYASAVQVIKDYISSLGDDDKDATSVSKWQAAINRGQ